MNQELLQTMNKYCISFIKKPSGIKEVHGTHYLSGFISKWGNSHPDDVIDFIADIDKCINRQFDFENLDTTMYSIDNYDTELVPAGLIFFNKNSTGYVTSTDIFPYEDIKILLVGWSNFKLLA
ncbi:hypothetical protein [Parasediminibacterium sp. JCM 36343]|uniref:hypothetical protein n=1 Tax=Parasediminibacterium sp. JCM 36343 TaxID=3374279 RepID=UPI00397B363A